MGAFALAYGVPAFPGQCRTRTGHPPAHPRCVGASTGQPQGACDCPGCTTLATINGRFPTDLGNASLRHLIRRCTATRPSDRPTTEQLRGASQAGALFASVFEHEETLEVDPPVDFQ